MGDKKLTAKEARFAEEYLVDLNAKQAAIRAGYSEKTAGAIGYENLNKPHVRDAIDAAKLERSEETKIDAAWVLTRLAEEAVADVADIFDDNGDLLPVKKWPKIWRQGLVQGVDVEIVSAKKSRAGSIEDDDVPETENSTRVTKVRLSERIRRIELIGKHVSVKAFEEQVAVTGLDALAERLERAARGEK